MLKTTNPNEYKGLKTEIERLISELEGETPGTKEYNEKLEEVVKLDSVNHTIVKATGFSKDAILAASVSILGMVLVINAEHVGAITTKAFGLIKWKQP